MYEASQVLLLEQKKKKAKKKSPEHLIESLFNSLTLSLHANFKFI